MTTALEGKTPERTPLGIYSFFMNDENPAWPQLIDRGLVPIVHTGTCYGIEHGVETAEEHRTEGDKRYHIIRKKTPVGTLQQVTVNGWHYEHFIKTPEDYKIRQWMIEHHEPKPCYENLEKANDLYNGKGFPVIGLSRTPAMSINIDWVGTEQFCLDVASEVTELFDLYEAQKKLFGIEVDIIARGPGRFVKLFENLTISMIGAIRYRDLLMNVYRAYFPILEKYGKRVFVHYDGELSPIADQIATAPFHGIESLTEPPEGDMAYDICRKAWPDLVFWANINLGLYQQPAQELAREVTAKRERAGKKGLAFEISEDLPKNWEITIPIVLEALEKIG